MQNRKIYNKFIVCLACSLMMIIAKTTIADSYTYGYPLRVTGEQGDPWALPKTPGSSPGFQQKPTTQGQQYQSRQIEKYDQGSRFITPEILESIKQQQIQTQLMPENKQRQLLPRQPTQNYGYQPLGMGFTNQLYDTPVISPWGSGYDLLYGGRSFP